MRFNILLLILLVLFFVAGLLLVSNNKAQGKEIASLRERVHNLEIVINFEMKWQQKEPAAFSRAH